MRQAVSELRNLAVRALQRMYRPQEGLFVFCLRRFPEGDQLEGLSRRYTAIALIALAAESQDVASTVLAGQNAHDVCGGLLKGVEQMDDLGEVALTLWAARALHHPRASRAVTCLQAMHPANRAYPTVELAWCVTALSVEGIDVEAEPLARSLVDRLLSSFEERSALFPHWPVGATKPWVRSHVTCFADLVYPIQALAHYHRATGYGKALEVARRCARRMCELQGPQGQWWWHYDVRTGKVIERFPVYSVHQDAMGPMALFDLEEVCGENHSEAIERSIQWLIDPPEIASSLIDKDADVIWRKVARHEPGKLTRSLQAMASRVHPTLRIPATDLVFRPGYIDYESRPYHMGWLLHAWSGDRAEQFTASRSG